MTEAQIPVSYSDPMSRRTFLHTLGAVSGSLMLAGLPQVQAQSASSTTFQLKAPEPAPKYGGTLRYGILSAPAHFDVHQSGTVSNMALGDRA
jgi:peptide/nickel transport system substrate-binding protein